MPLDSTMRQTYHLVNIKGHNSLTIKYQPIDSNTFIFYHFTFYAICPLIFALNSSKFQPHVLFFARLHGMRRQVQPNVCLPRRVRPGERSLISPGSSDFLKPCGPVYIDGAATCKMHLCGLHVMMSYDGAFQYQHSFCQLLETNCWSIGVVAKSSVLTVRDSIYT